MDPLRKSRDPHRFVRTATGEGESSPYDNGPMDSNAISSAPKHSRTKSASNLNSSAVDDTATDNDWHDSLSGWRNRRRQILATSLSTEMLATVGLSDTPADAESESNAARRTRVRSFTEMLKAHNHIVPVFDDESGIGDSPLPPPSTSTTVSSTDTSVKQTAAESESNSSASSRLGLSNESGTARKREVDETASKPPSQVNDHASTSFRMRNRSWWTEPEVEVAVTQKPQTTQISPGADSASTGARFSDDSRPTFNLESGSRTAVSASATTRAQVADEPEPRATFVTQLHKDQLKNGTAIATAAPSGSEVDAEPFSNRFNADTAVRSSPKLNRLVLGDSVGQHSASSSPSRAPGVVPEAQARKDIMSLNGAPPRRLIEDMSKSPKLSHRFAAPQPYRPPSPPSDDNKTSAPVAYHFGMSDHDYNSVARRIGDTPTTRDSRKIEPVATLSFDPIRASNNYVAPASLHVQNDDASTGPQLIQETRRRTARQTATESVNDQPKVAPTVSHTSETLPQSTVEARTSIFVTSLRTALGNSTQPPAASTSDDTDLEQWPAPPPPLVPVAAPVPVASPAPVINPAPMAGPAPVVVSSPALPPPFVQPPPLSAASRNPPMPAAPAPVRSYPNKDDRITGGRSQVEPARGNGTAGSHVAPPSTTTAVIVRQRQAPRHAAATNIYQPQVSTAPQPTTTGMHQPQPNVPVTSTLSQQSKQLTKSQTDVSASAPANNNARSLHAGPAVPAQSQSKLQPQPKSSINPATRKEPVRQNYDTNTNANTNKPVEPQQRESSTNRSANTQGGQQVCAGCLKNLSAGSAMYIEQLKSMYHLNCFVCSSCRDSLVSNDGMTISVYIRDRKLQCLSCSRRGSEPSSKIQSQPRSNTSTLGTSSSQPSLNLYAESARLPRSDAYV